MSGWITWKAGDRRPEGDALVKLRFEDETEEQAEATNPDRADAYRSVWRGSGRVRLIAYRIVEENRP